MILIFMISKKFALLDTTYFPLYSWILPTKKSSQIKQINVVWGRSIDKRKAKYIDNGETKMIVCKC